MHFDGTITLGALVSAATFAVTVFLAYVRATTWLERRLTGFETTLRSHAEQLERHGERMDRYEERYVKIAGDLQWLVGRMDGDRRGTPNRGHT
jgi:hypothetical protein